MAAYSGKFQYLDGRGAALSQGPCQFRFDSETAVLTPGSGTPIAFDLGDIDRFTQHDLDCELTLFNERTVQLRQFGAALTTMCAALLAAWRDRTVRCMVLEDLKEIARYNATVELNGAAAPAEIRLYESNLAVLPLGAVPVQWRLAEIDSVSFDDASYTLTLESAGARMAISKLAKKTTEFRQNLDEALAALRSNEAEALHTRFPFLDPDQLQRLVETMPEGRSTPLAALQAIDPKLADALIAHAVSPTLKPYFDVLRKRAVGDGVMTGYKFIRPDEEGGEGEENPDGEGKETKDQDPHPLFFWFITPLTGNRVAWEATSGSGRATYFFDAPAPVDQSIARLTRGLALVNFRREPIYLSDESLEQEQRFHRYAIGCRKMPDLRALRAAFRGRALHTSLEAWTAQVDGISSGATA